MEMPEILVMTWLHFLNILLIRLLSKAISPFPKGFGLEIDHEICNLPFHLIISFA